jgi:hypothetical protein
MRIMKSLWVGRVGWQYECEEKGKAGAWIFFETAAGSEEKRHAAGIT